MKKGIGNTEKQCKPVLIKEDVVNVSCGAYFVLILTSKISLLSIDLVFNQKVF